MNSYVTATSAFDLAHAIIIAAISHATLERVIVLLRDMNAYNYNPSANVEDLILARPVEASSVVNHVLETAGVTLSNFTTYITDVLSILESITAINFYVTFTPRLEFKRQIHKEIIRLYGYRSLNIIQDDALVFGFALSVDGKYMDYSLKSYFSKLSHV